MRSRLLRGILLALTLSLCLATPGGLAQAQVPERQRAFVYGINAAIARTFTGSFSPLSPSTIYLLADQPSIISPRITEIYFWPITNEYKASWEILNEPVAGTMEILQGGRVIQEIAPTSYTIHYQRNGNETVATLYIGAEADAAQERFAASQRAFRRASQDYYREQQAWLAAATEANQRIQAGERVTIPPEPKMPEPLNVTSNGLNNGVPVQLPVGSYTLRLRAPDGSLVPGSTRNLTIFAPRRSAVGYMVVPETRWTTPDQIEDPAAIILGKPNTQLYLIPHEAREYPAQAYTLLQNPQQQVGETTEWKWVLGSPIQQGELEIVRSTGETERRSLTPYRVQQTDGATLGYNILPFEPNPDRPNAAPDLVAFPLPIGTAGSSFALRMVSEQGQILPGSARDVHAPTGSSLIGLALVTLFPPCVDFRELCVSVGTITELALVTLLPLLAGAIIIIRRRLRMRLPRNISA